MSSRFLNNLFKKAYTRSQLSEKEKERIEEVISILQKLIPSRILEIGCADGRILNSLKANIKVGVDYHSSPLAGVQSFAFLGNILNLPFNENSFDLVICAEVIEHLNKGMIIKAISELKRVAQKHLFIMVPYKENLGQQSRYCNSCKAYTHIYGHLHKFDDKSIDKLFNLEGETFYIGKGVQELSLITKIKRITRNGNAFSDIRYCSQCDSSDQFRKNNILNKVLSLFSIILNKFRRKNPIWIAKLYVLENRELEPKNKIIKCRFCDNSYPLLDECEFHPSTTTDGYIDYR